MGWICGTHEGQERCVQGFVWDSAMHRDHFDNIGLDRRIILKFSRNGVGAWTGFISAVYEHVVG
jgi:hypothetical protein